MGNGLLEKGKQFVRRGKQFTVRKGENENGKDGKERSGVISCLVEGFLNVSFI